MLSTIEKIRLKLSCFLISKAIKIMPHDWQTKKAIKNLVSVGAIKTDKGE